MEVTQKMTQGGYSHLLCTNDGKLWIPFQKISLPLNFVKGGSHYTSYAKNNLIAHVQPVEYQAQSVVLK